MPRIDRMITNIRKFGVFTPNRYLIEFSGLLGVMDFAQGNRLSLMANTVSVPGRSIASSPNETSLGPSREMPYAPIYENELSIEFYLGKDVFERRAFEAWMDAIVDPTSGRLGYPKDYMCDAYIYILNEFDMPIYRIRLEEVWPKSVGPLEMSNAGGGEIAKQTITLNFTRYVPTIITLGGAVAAEFMYDIPAVRRIDDAVGGAMNELGIFGGKFGNPLNFSTLWQSWAKSGQVIERPLQNFNLGGLGNLI